MKAWTDYPFEALGDTAGKEAPVRECTVIAYDESVYCKIIVDGHFDEVKSGYLYSKRGRFKEVPLISLESLRMLPTYGQYGVYD